MAARSGMLALSHESLSGAQKSAVLCMALGSETASKVLQHLSPEDVEAVSREIAATPSVGAEVVEAVFGEFKEVARAVESVAKGGEDYARVILEQALGTGRAKSVLDKIREQLVDTGLRRLKKAAPELLHGVLRGEHPQTVALILAHLEPRQAAGLIESLDPALASDVLYRVARMEKVAPEMLQLVEAGLSSKTDLSLSQEMTRSGGPAAVANVLNLTASSMEKSMLEAISARSAELADAIKNLMFVFEDLRVLDSRAMQRILRDVEGKELALALKAASEDLKKQILASMSERAAAALSEEMEFLGAVRVKDVEAAQARILAAVRALEDSGEIVIAGKGSQDDVIA